MTESAHTAPSSAGRSFLFVGNFLFRYRNLVFPVVFLPLLLLTQPRPFAGSWETDAWIDAFGLALAASGQLLRVLVIGLAYIRRGGKEGRIYADTLVQEGLFAHSRNPLYLGNLIVIAGMLIVHGNPLATVIAAPLFFVAYLSITAAEEHYLADHFGAVYLDYCRRVPRFLPRLSGLRETTRGMRFNWRKVIRKEYGTLYSTATVGLAMVARERILAQGGWRWTTSLEIVFALWLLTNMLYIVARILKKRRLLGAD